MSSEAVYGSPLLSTRLPKVCVLPWKAAETSVENPKPPNQRSQISSLRMVSSRFGVASFAFRSNSSLTLMGLPPRAVVQP